MQHGGSSVDDTVCNLLSHSGKASHGNRGNVQYCLTDNTLMRYSNLRRDPGHRNKDNGNNITNRLRSSQAGGRGRMTCRGWKTTSRHYTKCQNDSGKKLPSLWSQQ